MDSCHTKAQSQRFHGGFYKNYYINFYNRFYITLGLVPAIDCVFDKTPHEPVIIF